MEAEIAPDADLPHLPAAGYLRLLIVPAFSLDPHRKQRGGFRWIRGADRA